MTDTTTNTTDNYYYYYYYIPHCKSFCEHIIRSTKVQHKGKGNKVQRHKSSVKEKEQNMGADVAAPSCGEDCN